MAEPQAGTDAIADEPRSPGAPGNAPPPPEEQDLAVEAQLEAPAAARDQARPERERSLRSGGPPASPPGVGNHTEAKG